MSPDGALIAMMGAANNTSVWDRATGEEVFTVQLGGAAGNLDWNPDGRHLAIASFEEGRAIIVDRSGQEVAVFSDAVGVADVEFSSAVDCWQRRATRRKSAPTGWHPGEDLGRTVRL